MNDKYRHAIINCKSAQKGSRNANVISSLAALKELRDYLFGDSKELIQADNVANDVGHYLGQRFPNKDCEDLIKKFIPK